MKRKPQWISPLQAGDGQWFQSSAHDEIFSSCSRVNISKVFVSTVCYSYRSSCRQWVSSQLVCLHLSERHSLYGSPHCDIMTHSQWKTCGRMRWRLYDDFPPDYFLTAALHMRWLHWWNYFLSRKCLCAHSQGCECVCFPGDSGIHTRKEKSPKVRTFWQSIL